MNRRKLLTGIGSLFLLPQTIGIGRSIMINPDDLLKKLTQTSTAVGELITVSMSQNIVYDVAVSSGDIIKLPDHREFEILLELAQ